MAGLAPTSAHPAQPCPSRTSGRFLTRRHPQLCFRPAPAVPRAHPGHSAHWGHLRDTGQGRYAALRRTLAQPWSPLTWQAHLASGCPVWVPQDAAPVQAGPSWRSVARASLPERGDAWQQRKAAQSIRDEEDVLCVALKPSPLLTAHEAVVAQLEALKAVYHPSGDIQLPHCGLEVLYSFAAIDPFNKGSTYFGKRLNVAYFSQFSAKFSLRAFKPLLGMSSYDVISSLHLSQTKFIARVGVRASEGSMPAVFLFDMAKKESGHLKGCWVTVSLQRVDMETDST